MKNLPNLKSQSRLKRLKVAIFGGWCEIHDKPETQMVVLIPKCEDCATDYWNAIRAVKAARRQREAEEAKRKQDKFKSAIKEAVREVLEEEEFY